MIVAGTVTRTIHQFVRAALWVLSGSILLLWARSNLVSDAYRWSSVRDRNDSFFQTRSEIYCGCGGIGLVRDWLGSDDSDRTLRLRRRAQQRAANFEPGYMRSDEPHYPPRVGDTDGWLSNFGIYCLIDVRAFRGLFYRQFVLTVPLWLLLLLACGYPATRYAVRVVRQERDQRIALGMCPRCECDVRGMQRCPSCGKNVAVADENMRPSRAERAAA